MDKQKVLLDDCSWNFLIILDACRYDAFNDVYKKIFDYGELKCTKSNATHTCIWLDKNLRGNYNDVNLYSTHPILNSLGITPDVWIPHSFKERNNKWKKNKWVATKYFKKENIYDLWREEGGEFDKNINNLMSKKTHPTNAVNKIMELDNFSERNLMWFIDPHGPCLADGLNENEHTHKERYYNDLYITLKNIERLMDYMFGKIIITADHGEIYNENLDEIKQPNHPPYKNNKSELINVPWFKINKIKE